MNIMETIKKLLPDVEISEDFVQKLTASIEATIAQRVDEQTKEITEKAEEFGKYAKGQIDEIKQKANAYSEYVVEEMTKKVEDYCEFVIEEFVKENKQKLVETEEYCRMAQTLRTIREAFETSYFALNAEPANVALQNKLSESKQSFNVLFEEHRNLKQTLEDLKTSIENEKRDTAFDKITESLADTQKERVKRLIEKANFGSIDAFQEGVKLIVEDMQRPTAQTGSSTKPDALVEKRESVIPSADQSENRMQIYLKSFSGK